MDKERLINLITQEVLKELRAKEIAPSISPPKAKEEPRLPTKTTTTVGASRTHLHLSRSDVDKLFGPDYELKVRNKLNQPGEFAAQETVSLIGPKMRALENVRIVGPLRDATQVELSRTDAIFLGINAPLRVSGDHRDTPGLTIIGPTGTVVLERGVMRANRHIHITPAEASQRGLKDRQIIAVKTLSPVNSAIFNDVMIRVSEQAYFELHIDTDDANAAELKTGDTVELLL